MTEYFTDNDKTEFIECGYEILNTTYSKPLSVQKPDFSEKIVIHLYLILKQLPYIIDNNIPKKVGNHFIKCY